jgi:phosphoheptose isomerase
MDYYAIIAGHFQRTVEAVMSAVDPLAAPLERASRMMVAALLAEGKICACGNGADAALARLLVAKLMGQFEHERPALPALTLAADSVALSGVPDSDQAVARQLAALGRQGDILLCINSGAPAASLTAALGAAQSRGLQVVLLTHTDDHQLPQCLDDGDVVLRVDAGARAQIIEIHTMLLNCLYGLLDRELFGDFNRDV